jgi:hypothetical protein
MNGGIVTGVGNIYASEALFGAGIHPARSAGRISAPRWDRLADSIRHTLENAIDAGGSTARDFVSAEGRPGYFQHRHAVRDRAGKACPRCRAKIARFARASARRSSVPGARRERLRDHPRGASPLAPTPAETLARPAQVGRVRAPHRRAGRGAAGTPRAQARHREAHDRIRRRGPRGKGELINALFFAESGARLLPSIVGKTIQCPTEILWDDTRRPSIRLLPSETRESPRALRELLDEIDTWQEVPLDPLQPQSLAKTCEVLLDAVDAKTPR